MSELALLLIGASIALVSSIIGAWVQHFLSLRADRIKRERDRLEETRRMLLEGVRDEALREALRQEATGVRAIHYAMWAWLRHHPRTAAIDKQLGAWMKELDRQGEKERARKLRDVWSSLIFEMLAVEAAAEYQEEGQDEPAE